MKKNQNKRISRGAHFPGPQRTFKLLLAFFCLAMVLVLLPGTATAADSEGTFSNVDGVTYYEQLLDFTIDGWDFRMKYKLDEETKTATFVDLTGATTLFTGNEELQILDKIVYQDEEYTVTTIGEKAFWQEKKIKSITLPETITTIEDLAFDHCEGTEHINIPQGVKHIGYGAFNMCVKLQEINIPDGITEIPGAAFGACYAVSSLTIPDSVTTIGKGAFTYLGKDCVTPLELVIPNSVTLLETDAFRSANIRSVTFPRGRTEPLEVNDAFPSCPSLKRIEVLSDLVESTNYVEFRGCASDAVMLTPYRHMDSSSVPTRIMYTVNPDGETVTINYVGATALSQTPEKIGDWYVSAVPDGYKGSDKHVHYFGDNNALQYCMICNAFNTNHTHHYGTEWSSDRNNHWHVCTCGDKDAESAHDTFSWVKVSESDVSETWNEQCGTCGYARTSEKRPKAAPAQPTYADLATNDSDHTYIVVELHCAEDGTTCQDPWLTLFANGGDVGSYDLGEVRWDAAKQKWYCDVRVHAAPYVKYYGQTQYGCLTAHELASTETSDRELRFWYYETDANPWKKDVGFDGIPYHRATFEVVHTKIPRTVSCKVRDVSKNFVELSIEISQMADEGEVVLYAMGSEPGTVPSDSEFTANSRFENLLPDTTYYFWAKVEAYPLAGLLEAVSLPLRVTTSHDWNPAWENNDTWHWHECACGAQSEKIPHSFQWVVDKAATATEKGLKHEECMDCGYKKTAVEIPATGTTEPDNPDNPDGPDDPNKPDNPNNPNDPDGPANPDNPTTPDNPDNPNNPNNPDGPANPDGPTTPDNPDKPNTPTNPSDPATPNNPGGSGETNGSTGSSGKIDDANSGRPTNFGTPQTGDNGMEMIWLFLMVLIGTGLIGHRQYTRITRH